MDKLTKIQIRCDVRNSDDLVQTKTLTWYIGDRVREIENPKYAGPILEIGDGRVYVRWHKGLATWVSVGLLERDV